MAFAELTALIVALIALVIALLQVAQPHALSATARSKVNRAAIGPMAKKNKYSWTTREWKLRIRYARVDTRAVMTALEDPNRSAESERFHTELSDYYFKWGSDGVDHPTKLTVVHREDESRTPVRISMLTPKQRDAITDLEKKTNRTNRRLFPCKASWCNMMTDLGIDPCEFPTKDSEYLDADTIPTVLDAPITYIRMSDMVLFGFLLDMKIRDTDVERLSVNMIGRDCNIKTEHQGTAGMVSRYSGLSPEIRPMAMYCEPLEVSMLLLTASGSLTIGDTVLDMLDLGYNSVDHIFSEIISRLQGDSWQEVVVADVMGKVKPDGAFHWSGRWASPIAPAVPLLLALCGNLSTANAFPHCNLRSWASYPRARASMTAFQYIQGTIKFTNAPQDLFEVMGSKTIDLVLMNHFKIANNWGCERGGMRSWLAGNFSEFVDRMGRYWEVSDVTEEVPLLPQLHPFLQYGTLNVKMVEELIGRPEQSHGGESYTASMFWLQIMMFDTWIARCVERIIGNTNPMDLTIPAPSARAREWVQKEGKMTRTGWKKSRLMFARAYLRRLAEGRNGQNSSFMAEVYYDGSWEGMQFGKPSDWAEVDAVLTLCAVVMAVRLESMKDSTVLLDLRRMDPMVRMV